MQLGERERPEGLIPAYAGSTSIRANVAAIQSAHPRLRGEHPRWGTFHAGLDGSSPLTRGAPRIQSTRFTNPGLIPAYAGST